MPEADWRPRSSPAVARRRADMLAAARRFFAERGVLEVETPVLSRHAVTDSHIDSIRASLDLRPGETHYLRTSPELAMKRLLCAGWPDVYELGRVFRDGEAGPRHRPEFTMIEWYRRGFDLQAIMRETADLLRALLPPERLAAADEVLSYRDAFVRHAGLDPLTADLDALREAAVADPGLSASLGDRRDDWLDLLLATRVAPAFPADRLTVVHHYPAAQAALARLSPADPATAERFEVFRGALELANGFVELGCAAEQAERFARDLALRRARGKPEPPVDERFLAALGAGLPDCAGVAAGFDRLVMIDAGSDDIADVLPFGFE